MITHLRRLFAMLAAACMLSACGGHNDNVPLVAATILSGREQIPANASNAEASGVVTVDEGERTLVASVYTSGIAGTAVHLHNAPRGATGPVLLSLSRVGTSNLWTGSVLLSDTQWRDLRNGNFYFDVESLAYPDGELRGQVYEDNFPPSEHVEALEQASPQSPLLAEQLRQLDDYEDWWHGDSSGLVIGLSFGF